MLKHVQNGWWVILGILVYSVQVRAVEPVIFPKPKQMHLREGESFQIRPATRILVGSEEHKATAEQLQQGLYALTGSTLEIAFVSEMEEYRNAIVLGTVPGNTILKDILSNHALSVPTGTPYGQAYVLLVTDDIIAMAGQDTEGIFYGMQTLLSLVETYRSQSMPGMALQDYPDLKYRGLFLEDKWGPDRMTLQDFKDMIDFMARHKMNMLSIGVYGCWETKQFRNEFPEFLMTPLPDYPQLQTPKVVEYYSPADKQWQRMEYLPIMFEQDLLDDVIQYGKTRYVNVHPDFNSMGHNRLIPRMFPEISSRDASGNPKGYGFCISEKKTYEILFSMYDHIIDTYLAPNGINWFDVEMDEVRGWCECPSCSRIPHEEQYIRHLIKISQYLHERGIAHIGIYDDMLGRHGLVNESLVNRLKTTGLENTIILQWWWYRPPEERTNQYPHAGFRPELGLRNWVMPMTGYLFPYSFTYGYPRMFNIHDMLSLAKSERAEGSESYCIYDPGHHKDLTAFSEYSWNLPAGSSTDDIDRFLHRYCRKYFGSRWKQATAIFDAYHQLILEEGKDLWERMLYYGYSYVRTEPYAKRPYPEEALKRLRQLPDAQRRLERASGRIGVIRDFFHSALAAEDGDHVVILQYYADAVRLHNLAEEFLLLMEIDASYTRLRAHPELPGQVRLKLVTSMQHQSGHIRRSRLETMTTWQRYKPEYLHPHELRNMSFMLKYLDELDQRLQQLETHVREERSLDSLPASCIIGTTQEL